MICKSFILVNQNNIILKGPWTAVNELLPVCETEELDHVQIYFSNILFKLNLIYSKVKTRVTFVYKQRQ
jgi:hypothetical protein